MTEQKRAIAIYSRKSRFTGKGESIENQVELCRRYVAAHEGERAAAEARVYEDEGFSGGNLERPQFRCMMTDARAKKLSAVVVYRLDRISRNIGDFARLIEELNDLQISFVSIREQFDTDSPMGRAMMYIASVFSQLERETIAERIRDNMRELAKTGRWLGGVTPTGYASEQVTRVTVDGKTRKACHLKLIPEEAAVIRLIFDQFLETDSLTKTDAYLLEKGYTTKNGKRFTRCTIKNILINPVYMMADGDAYRYLTQNGADLFAGAEEFDGRHGILAYNRTLQRAGCANRIRPMQEWIVTVGRHPGLVTGDRWVKVQGLLDLNRSKAYRKPRGNAALLSGVLVCGDCGGYMRPKMTRRMTAEGTPLYTYLCNLKERSRSQCCRIRNVNGNLLDQAVVAELRKLPEDKDELMRQLEAGKRTLQESREEESDGQIARLNAELQGSEAEIRALVSSLARASGTPAEEHIVRKIDELHGAGERLKRRIGELKQPAGSPGLSDRELDALRERLCSFQSMLDGMSVEQKRAAVRACVEKAVWDGESVHLYAFGSGKKCGPPELPAGNAGKGESGKASVPAGRNSK